MQIWCFRRGSHCEIFQSVCNARKRRCVLGQNLMGYALKCTLYPNICNKTPENYTQIYAVRKLVPKCAYFTAGNRHKQNSWFCKEIREDNFRFWWRRVHEDASQGMFLTKMQVKFSLFFHHGSLNVIGDKFRFVRSKLKSR